MIDPQPQAVVTVNGMRAVCFKQNCNYEITTTGVPTVTDFNVDFYTGVVTLGINEHFPGDASLITITVEGEPCSSVTITSITEITCQLPLDTSSKPLIPGGKWVPYIMTPTGAADVSSVLGTPKTPLISDIVPPTVISLFLELGPLIVILPIGICEWRNINNDNRKSLH